MNPILDDCAVKDVVNRYMSYVDRRRWSDVAPLFAEEVYVDYSRMRAEEVARTEPISRILAGWKERHTPFKAWQHHLGSMVADIEGDKAQVHATGFASHFKSPPQGEGMLLWQVGVAYEWLLARRDGRWRIHAVTAIKLWERSELQPANPA